MSSYMPKSKSDVHLTPPRVFQMIKEHWGYSKDDMFDPCPSPRAEWDGLLIDYHETNYINPPYSDLKFWVIKAFEEADKGKTTIMLLPAKTDQDFFHWLVDNNCEIIWIKRRLKFTNNKWSSTQSHFLVMIKARVKAVGYLESKIALG